MVSHGSGEHDATEQGEGACHAVLVMCGEAVDIQPPAAHQVIGQCAEGHGRGDDADEVGTHRTVAELVFDDSEASHIGGWASEHEDQHGSRAHPRRRMQQ